MDDKVFITANDVATLAGVRVNTVCQWVQSGQLRHSARIGKAKNSAYLFFNINEVMAFVKDYTEKREQEKLDKKKGKGK